MASTMPAPDRFERAKPREVAIGSTMLEEIARAMTYAHSYNEISKEGITSDETIAPAIFSSIPHSARHVRRFRSFGLGRWVEDYFEVEAEPPKI